MPFGRREYLSVSQKKNINKADDEYIKSIASD